MFTIITANYFTSSNTLPSHVLDSNATISPTLPFLPMPLPAPEEPVGATAIAGIFSL